MGRSGRPRDQVKPEQDRRITAAVHELLQAGEQASDAYSAVAVATQSLWRRKAGAALIRKLYESGRQAHAARLESAKGYQLQIERDPMSFTRASRRAVSGATSRQRPQRRRAELAKRALALLRGTKRRPTRAERRLLETAPVLTPALEPTGSYRDEWDALQSGPALKLPTWRARK